MLLLFAIPLCHKRVDFGRYGLENLEAIFLPFKSVDVPLDDLKNTGIINSDLRTSQIENLHEKLALFL